MIVIGLIKGGAAHSPTASNERQHCEHIKHDSSRDTNERDRQFVGQTVPNRDGRNVGEHHAKGRTDDDRVKMLEPSRETDSGDLRLIADLGEKESDQCRGEAPQRGRLQLSSATLSGNSAQIATLKKVAPRIQRIHGPSSKLPTKAPVAPAAAWLARVATRIPKMIGNGRRNARRVSSRGFASYRRSRRARRPRLIRGSVPKGGIIRGWAELNLGMAPSAQPG
jgi:hypothetical protein